MQGTQFAQFSAEVLRRGAAAVLPQHLPDHWLDALLAEADVLGPGDGDPEAGDRAHECCAGLLGAVLVALMAQQGHPDQLDVAVNTLMSHLVWSKYSSLPSHRKLRLYHRPRVGLSSAPLFPILSVHRDGKA